MERLKEIIKEEVNKFLNEATLYHGTTSDVKLPLDSSKTKDKNIWLAKSKEDAIMAAMKKGLAKKKSDIVIHHVKPKGLEITPKGNAVVVKGTIGKGNISKTDSLK